MKVAHSGCLETLMDEPVREVAPSFVYVAPVEALSDEALLPLPLHLEDQVLNLFLDK